MNPSNPTAKIKSSAHFWTGSIACSLFVLLLLNSSKKANAGGEEPFCQDQTCEVSLSGNWTRFQIEQSVGSVRLVKGSAPKIILSKGKDWQEQKCEAKLENTSEKVSLRVGAKGENTTARCTTSIEIQALPDSTVDLRAGDTVIEGESPLSKLNVSVGKGKLSLRDEVGHLNLTAGQIEATIGQVDQLLGNIGTGKLSIGPLRPANHLKQIDLAVAAGETVVVLDPQTKIRIEDLSAENRSNIIAPGIQFEVKANISVKLRSPSSKLIIKRSEK